jgi:arginyl-tRNA synthetase
MNAFQLYSGNEDIKNPTEELGPEIQTRIVTETHRVGNPMVEVVSEYAQPIITFFRKKLVPEVDNVKEEEQWRKAIEKVLEEMKDYLEKVGIGIDKKEELANLILRLVKQIEQE